VGSPQGASCHFSNKAYILGFRAFCLSKAAIGYYRAYYRKPLKENQALWPKKIIPLPIETFKSKIIAILSKAKT
jgi:hypothetical protein